MYSEIWHLKAPKPGLVGINAEAAWRKAPEEGHGVKVVIFDTGVEYDHPSLKDRVDLNDARDFDHDFTAEGLGFPDGLISNRYDAHGTACAGIVGAGRIGGVEVVGIAPRCTLVPVRISTVFDTERLIQALNYAAKVGDVILLPRYMARSAKLDDALRDIASRKPVVCASGNDGTGQLIYPASLPETIAVGACNEKGYRSSYSQYGPGLDVVAPSNDVPCEDNRLVRIEIEEAEQRLWEEEARAARRSGDRVPDEPQPHPAPVLTVPEALLPKSQARHWNVDRLGVLSIATTDNLGEDGYNFEPAGDYCKASGHFGFGGTSAAAAQVAGVVALMLSVNRSLSPADVQDILRTTAVTTSFLQHERAEKDEFGSGLVDALAAVEKAAATR